MNSSAAARQLVEILEEDGAKGPSITGGGLFHDFPKTESVDFDPEAVYEASVMMRRRATGIKDFYRRHYLSELLQALVQMGHTHLEVQPTGGGDAFPYCLSAVDDKPENRVQLVIDGSLGDHGCTNARNLDVLVRGSAGNMFMIFGKNSRAYVAGSPGVQGTVGNMPLLTSESCELDAYAVGPNPLGVEDGRIHVRGWLPEKIHDYGSFRAYLDEAEDLTGHIPNLPVKMLTPLIVWFDLRHSGVELTCSGPGNRYFKQEESFGMPFWVPQPMYSPLHMVA